MRHISLPAGLRPIGALTVGLLLVACADPGSSSPGAVATSANPYGFNGTYVESGYAKPGVVLTDTAGRPYSIADDTTKPITLLFFMYTNCPDVCPTTLADIAAALRRVDPAARDDVDVVAVTTDPARDTPDVMRAYLGQFDPSFVGLTGDLADIEQAAAALGVALTGQEMLPSGGYAVGHGAQVIGFGPAGAVIWSESTPVGVLRHDIEIMLEQV